MILSKTKIESGQFVSGIVYSDKVVIKIDKKPMRGPHQFAEIAVVGLCNASILAGLLACEPHPLGRLGFTINGPSFSSGFE